jgi:Ser-tRNA(Ala) deacylase AlaX
MKTILLLTCVTTLFATTGCFFPGRGGGHWHDRGELIVPNSAVAVRVPEVIVAPPLIEASAPEVVVR